MGNGESTSRRVSMQRSDDGSIQIAENVLLRLHNEKTRPENEVILEPGEMVIQEKQVKQMLEQSFAKGQSTAIAKLQEERMKEKEEQKKLDNEKQAEHEKQLQQLAQYWKEQFELETSKVRDISLEDDQAFAKYQEELSEKEKSLTGEKETLDATKQSLDEAKQALDAELNDLNEKRHALLDEKNKLEEERLNLREEREKLTEEKYVIGEEKSLVDQEKDSLELKRLEIDGKLREREVQLHEEFERIAEEVDKKIRPLQRATICSEFQEKVLSCYRENKKQPLRCSKEVQDFVNCVQEARLRLMEKKLSK